MNSAVYINTTASLCVNITSPANGGVSAETVRFNESVTYNCIDGFNLTGESTQYCNEQCDAKRCQLSGLPPTCISKSFLTRYACH